MRILFLILGSLILMSTPAVQGETITLKVHPEKVANKIDERIYGHFLEHIYHSVHGGLWGELTWNRSFESCTSRWVKGEESVAQKAFSEGVPLLFGESDWKDYEITLQARKISGLEGFLIIFRHQSPDEFYWLNLGGYQNIKHVVERSRRIVSPEIERKIETGRWYNIRLRCEGSHIQVWLDEEKVFDFSDDNAILQGRVGVATWLTRAEFRNIQVTSLQGEVLYEGLPEPSRGSTEIEHWQLTGDEGKVATTSEALNGSVAVHIKGQGGGVRQEGLCLRLGQTYEGSLWAKGNPASSLQVRLVRDDETLDSAELSVPRNDEWTRLPFSLTSPVSCPGAALEITADRGEVLIDQVVLMPRSWKEKGGFRPDLFKAVSNLRPPVIRWPGGCYAERYRWKDGIGKQHERGHFPLRMWDDLDPNSFGTDEFMRLCRTTGAEPVLVINSGRHDPDTPREEYIQEACDWLEYCNGPADSTWGKVRAANGHPEPYGVKYWEIDNEAWPIGAGEYIEIVKAFVPALKKIDPSIEIFVCGSAGYDNNPVSHGWNKAVIEGCGELFDVISIHHYEAPENFAKGPRHYEEFFRQIIQHIRASANPDIRIFVSEWNAQSTDWRTGLYAGGLLNAFERCGNYLTLATPALFLRHVSAPEWDNAFINFDSCGWFPAPNYVVMKLWRDHYTPERLDLQGDPGAVNIAAGGAGDQKTIYLKAVNPSEKEADLEVILEGNRLPLEAGMTLIAPGELQARNTLARPAWVWPEKAEARVNSSRVLFTLPPYSAAVVEVNLAD
jgi:alpha-N-arabinofuranosidase